MNEIIKKCFVCQNDVPTHKLELNQAVNLMVCTSCKGTPKEKQTVNELLESLADGFVCGCI
jgi:predicted metal-binding protein